jgi:protein-L-isoaspartate(D-aspartate) O-methyltransferase
MYLTHMNMVEQQIRPWAIENHLVLDALRQVPRDLYVPKDLRDLAYADLDIPLVRNEAGEVLVSMLSPKVEAKILQTVVEFLGETETKKQVLVVGFNSPYLVALLLHLGFLVKVCESEEKVLTQVEPLLQGKKSLSVSHQNFFTQPELDQFDAVIFAAAIDVFDQSYLQLLKPTGCLVTTEGRSPVMQTKVYQVDVNKPSVSVQVIFETVLPYLSGVPRKSGFSF